MSDKKSNGGLNPVIAGVAGAVVGAAVGAAAVALSDEENRKKVAKAAEDLKERGGNLASQLVEEGKKLQNLVPSASEEDVKSKVKNATKGAK